MTTLVCPMKILAIIHPTNWPVVPLLGRTSRIARTILPVAGIFLCFSLAAQSNQPAPTASSGPFKTDFLWASATTNRLRLGAFVDYVYVAPGDVDFYGTKGHSEAQSVNVLVTGEIPLNQRWYMPLGLGSANTWFSTVFGVPIPDQIDTLHLNAGLGYRFNDQWTVSGSFGPVLYTLHDIKSDDVGFVGTARAVYRPKPNLIVTFGIAVNPDSDIPVFPAFGARWDIQTNLTLNLIFPKPGVIYRPTPKVSLFVGGGLNGATFRTDDQMGVKTGLPQFNRALATYWDFHLGAGFEYAILRHVSVNVEGGYSLGRQIRYDDPDETVKFDPSPYVQAEVRCRF